MKIKKEHALLELIDTLKSIGYNNNDILEIINNDTELLEILEFHLEVLIDKKNTCSNCINELENMIEEIKGKENEIFD